MQHRIACASVLALATHPSCNPVAIFSRLTHKLHGVDPLLECLWFVFLRSAVIVSCKLVDPEFRRFDVEKVGILEAIA